MSRFTALAAALLALFAVHADAGPASSYTLAEHADWGGNRGFFIHLENDPGANGKCSLSTLKLASGIGDGTHWEFMGATPAWSEGQSYTATLHVDAQTAILSLDGSQVAQLTNVSLSSGDGPINGALPPWPSSPPAEYEVVQTDFEIDDAAGKHAADIHRISRAAAAFGNVDPASIDWKYTGQSFTVRVQFHIDDAPDFDSLYPLVDRYGQPTFVDYAGKITSDADLRASITAEKKHEAGWSASRPYNKYGGLRNPPWHDKATGYYRVVEHAGIWWMIDPTGAPLFYDGLDSLDVPAKEGTPVTGRESLFAWLPSKDSEFGSAVSTNFWGGEPDVEYVSFANANAIRKYGADWKSTYKQVQIDRMNAWGFSGLGKWSANWPGVPNIPVIYTGSVPNLVHHPDIFDPAIQSQLEDAIAKVVKPDVDNPWIVGWSYGNEYDELITADEIRDILKMPVDNPSRKALVDFAVSQLYAGDASKAAAMESAPDSDIEQMRRFYEDRFYATVHDDIKAVDPHHLFFGWWLVPHWWQNESDWKLQAAHVDVLGIDHYNRYFSDSDVLRWIKESDKPVLIGEYGFPQNFNGERGYGKFFSEVSTPAEAGVAYDEWMRDVTRNPKIVGACFFQMRDEMITGRGPGHGSNLVYDEHLAVGLIDETDTPKWDLVDKVHAANLQATKWRLQAGK